MDREESLRIKNPFYPLRVIPETPPDFIAESFIPTHFWDKVMENTHHLIVGGSGTGKTILLRRLALETQVEASPELQKFVHPYIIGIYVLLGAELSVHPLHSKRINEVGSQPVDTKGGQDWNEEQKKSYMHYFSLVLIKRFCEAIAIACEKKYSNFNKEIEKEIVKRILAILGSEYGNKTTLKDISFQIWKEMTNLVQNSEPLSKTQVFTPKLVTKWLSEILKDISSTFDNPVKLWWLLDELHKLSVNEQSVVFELVVEEFGHVTKITTRPFEVLTFRSISGSVIEFGPRIKTIPLVFTHSDEDERIKLLENIGDKRLSVFKEQHRIESPAYLESIRGLLKETGFPEERFNSLYMQSTISKEEKIIKGKETYLGFDAFAKLSSLNVGTFLNLCALAWYFMIEEDTSFYSKGESINESCQTRAVEQAADEILEIIQALDAPPGPYLTSIIAFLCDEIRNSAWDSNKRFRGNTICIEIPPLFESLMDTKIEKIIQEGFTYGAFYFAEWKDRYLFDIPIEGLTINRLLFYKHGLPWWGEGMLRLPEDTLRKKAEISPPFIRKMYGGWREKVGQVREGEGALKCFLSVSFEENPEIKTVRDWLKSALLGEFGIVCLDIEDMGIAPANKNKLDRIIEEIKKHDFVVMDVSSIRPNVMLELGICYGREKPAFLLVNQNAFEKLPREIRGPGICIYTLNEESIRKAAETITSSFRQYGTSAYSGFKRNLMKQEQKCLYISWPSEKAGLWESIIGRITEEGKKKGFEIITDEDASPHWDLREKGWFCIHASGRSLIDITSEDPLRSFLLGFSYGKSKKRQTWCCWQRGWSKNTYPSLWNGKSSFEWKDQNDLINHIVNKVFHR